MFFFFAIEGLRCKHNRNAAMQSRKKDLERDEHDHHSSRIKAQLEESRRSEEQQEIHA